MSHSFVFARMTMLAACLLAAAAASPRETRVDETSLVRRNRETVGDLFASPPKSRHNDRRRTVLESKNKAPWRRKSLQLEAGPEISQDPDNFVDGDVSAPRVRVKRIAATVPPRSSPLQQPYAVARKKRLSLVQTNPADELEAEYPGGLDEGVADAAGAFLEDEPPAGRTQLEDVYPDAGPAPEDLPNESQAERSKRARTEECLEDERGECALEEQKAPASVRQTRAVDYLTFPGREERERGGPDFLRPQRRDSPRAKKSKFLMTANTKPDCSGEVQVQRKLDACSGSQGCAPALTKTDRLLGDLQDIFGKLVIKVEDVRGLISEIQSQRVNQVAPKDSVTSRLRSRERRTEARGPIMERQQHELHPG